MKKKKIVSASAAVVVALFMFAGCSGKSGEKQYNKALSAWKDGDLVRARALFENSINKMSGNSQKSTALNQLGLVLWELGESQAAADAFSTSANLAETLSGANLNMGIALYHTGRIDEAEVALNNVLGENPKNETALAILGLIELQKRNWAGATTELTKSASINPRSAAAQNALALAELHQTKNSERAITRLKQLISANPDYAPAAYNLGSIYDHWLRNPSAAMSWYKQYLQKAGENGSHVQSAANAVARLGGTPATTSTTRSAAPKVNPAEAARYMAEGSKLHGAQKYDEAIVAYRKALAADPKHKTAYYNMGLAFYAQGNYSDAATACNSALNIDPNFSDARYMLSLAYAKQKKWNDAEREARELSKTDATRGGQMKKYISDSRK
ncbi:tetratricopeptide repeat protein [Pontiellaceae bacterium B12227]|nr:tetratricopeptide repeat protein [Pontiellaceae bacterium B12227]